MLLYNWNIISSSSKIFAYLQKSLAIFRNFWKKFRIFGNLWQVVWNLWKIIKNIVIAVTAGEPEVNEWGSSLINRRLHYRGLQSLFLTKRKELWLCASGRFRMRSGMQQGIVVMHEWEGLGCTAYQKLRLTKGHEISSKGTLSSSSSRQSSVSWS